MNLLPFKTRKQLVDDAIRTERERCLDCVRYSAALAAGDYADRLGVAYKHIEKGAPK